jgi:hypothetical protein
MVRLLNRLPGNAANCVPPRRAEDSRYNHGDRREVTFPTSWEPRNSSVGGPGCRHGEYGTMAAPVVGGRKR